MRRGDRRWRCLILRLILRLSLRLSCGWVAGSGPAAPWQAGIEPFPFRCHAVATVFRGRADLLGKAL